MEKGQKVYVTVYQENKVEEVKVYKDAYESRSNGSICHERLVPVEGE